MSAPVAISPSQPINRNGDKHFDMIVDFLSGLPLIILLSDQTGNVLYATPTAGVVFGFDTDSKLIFSDVLGSSLGNGQAASIAESVARDGGWAGEIRIYRGDGSKALIDLAVKRMSSADGSYFDLLFGQDITDTRFKSRAACRGEIVATRGDMAGEISHELNNYLSIVMGNLELLGMAVDRGKFDSLEARLKSIKDGLDRIIKFIEGLMSLCRPDSNREVFYIQRLLDEEIFFLKGDACFSGVEFVCNWTNDLPPIEADRSRLRQGLVNILTNAADAVSGNQPGNKKITIDISRSDSDGSIYLSICDNGPGMNEEDYQRAFRQFFTTKGPGHGFGLLAIKGAIKSQGGKVTVSPGPGGGACFKIDLPCQQSSDRLPADASA